jgi:hypothetical protein
MLGFEEGKDIDYMIKNGLSGCSDHLRQAHGLVPPKEEQAKASISIIDQLHGGGAVVAPFDPKTFREKLLRFIAVCHIPFAIVEQAAFRDLLLYASPPLRGNDTLPKSGNSIRTWLLELYIVCQVLLIKLLLESNCQVHISFDLWTSPNNFSMLGLCCHFIDRSWQARTVILGMKRLIGPHSGDNMATLLKQVLQTYKLGPRLGYCVLDNAGDNDTCLRAVEDHLLLQGIRWNADEHRLRCFGHIVNLIATAFLENKPTKEARVRRLSGEPKPIWTRSIDAISKLHNIVVFIMLTAQRIEQFEKINKSTHDPLLHPKREQATRWFSTLNMLRRAIQVKDSIDLFVARNSDQSSKEKTLFDSIMSQDDWNYAKEVIAFMEPLEELMLSLQGKEISGM